MLRVTPLSISSNSLANYQNLISNLGRLQFQASSGLKYQRPSDAPLETHQINSLKHSVFKLTVQQTQIEDANQRLNFSVTSLVEANNLLTRTRQVALEAPQTLGTTDRQALAHEVDKILDRLVAIANFKDAGQYLFAGAAISTEPIWLRGLDGLDIPTVSYDGAQIRGANSVSDSITIDTHYTGEELFFDQDRAQSLFFGDTGAKAGTAVDSGKGRATLNIRHMLTSFANGSGVQAGSASVDGDTVIGQLGTHHLNIRDTSGNGSSGTVSLNDGREVPWTSSDTNLLVHGLGAQQIFLDMSNITAGFDGRVDVQSDGMMSIDGGATETAIDFSENQIVENSLDGSITHVDTRDLTLSGAEHIEYTGSADLFTTMLELKDDLLNSRGLDEQSLAEAFDRRLTDIQRHSDRLLDFVGQQSVSLQDLERLQTYGENLKLEFQSRLADLESVDLASVVVELQNQQTLIQFNFASISLLQSTSILDFIG